MKIRLLFFFILTFPAFALSQNRTGIGNVSDNTGIVIPNAVVRISPASDATIVYEYLCDKNGNYSFDIASSDDVFLLNIQPTRQSLQFTHDEEHITLSYGSNGILFHNVDLTGTNSISFTVVDTSGNPIPDAAISLYDTKGKWRADSCRIAKSVYTDNNGQVTVNSLLQTEYWFNIRSSYLTNKFTVKNVTIDGTGFANSTVPVRDLTKNEFYMCGTCDNKTWITDSIVVFGVSSPYDADSKLSSDGTWFDSNDNHGLWWFYADETKMIYDYDSSSSNGGGSVVEADLLELTESSFVGDMKMLGLPVTYYMSSEYDTVLLNISAQDTTIYLNSNGTAYITPDDLEIYYDDCFTCSVTLSRSSFDINDIGDVDVYVSLEDRCGNIAVDTMTLTIRTMRPNGIDEFVATDMKIYPNPAGDYILIESNNDPIERIELFDLTGRIVKRFTVNNEQFVLNTADLRQGIYFFRIHMSSKILIKKLVVR